MSTPLANQPAFPQSIAPQGRPIPMSADLVIGLSKREHYAGLAMQGMMAAYQPSERLIGLSHDAEAHGETKVEQTIARWAVDQADALLAALEEKK